MGKPILTREQIEEAANLRERGWSLNRLALRFKCSASAMSWHMLKEGADPKNRRTAVLSQVAPGPSVMKRGNHEVRHFTPGEDQAIQRMALAGLNDTAIGRSLTPARRPNSIRGRLMTLARHQQRAENAGQISGSAQHG